MKYSSYTVYRRLFSFNMIILSFTASLAWSDNGMIKCGSVENNEPRIWKYETVEDDYYLWTMNSQNFFPFCSIGYSVQFPDGFLCAYDADRAIGTIATFINVKDAKVIDILIWEDTVLHKPDTWRQKSETLCELIRN